MDAAALPRFVEKRLPGRAQAAIELYTRILAPQSAAEPWRVFSAIETDRVFRMPALAYARARSGAQSPTFMYEFDWRGPLFQGEMGSCHTMEVPFVLGMVDDGFGRVFTGGGPSARALSEMMMDAWLAFARLGQPGTQALGSWPAYGGSQESIMKLSRPCGIGTSISTELDHFWAEII
jgi:para-nitrobenzyl esterase